MPQGTGDELTVSGAGWHLSYFSSVHDIARKIQSFSHIELNTPEVTNVDNIRRNVDNGLDVFNRKDAILRRYDFNGGGSSLPDLFRTYQPIIRNYQADMHAHNRLLHATVFITVARHSDLSVAFGLRKALLLMGFSKVSVSHELSLREVRRLKALAVRDYNEHGLVMQVVVSSCSINDSDRHNVDSGGSSYSGFLLRNYLLHCTSLTTDNIHNVIPSSADSTQPTQSTHSTQSTSSAANMPRTGGLVEEASAVLVTRDSAASAAIARRVWNLTRISLTNVVVLPAEHHSPLYFDSLSYEKYRQHSVHPPASVTSVDHMIDILLLDSDGTDIVTNGLAQLLERFCAERNLSCISSSDIASTGMLTMGDAYTWEYFVTHSKVVVVAGRDAAQQDMVAIESLLRFNKCVLYVHSDHSNSSNSDSNDGGSGVYLDIKLSDLLTIVPVTYGTDYSDVLFAQLTSLLSRVNSVGSSCDSRLGASSLLPPERQLERDMAELQEIVFDVLEAV